MPNDPLEKLIEKFNQLLEYEVKDPYTYVFKRSRELIEQAYQAGEEASMNEWRGGTGRAMYERGFKEGKEAERERVIALIQKAYMHSESKEENRLYLDLIDKVTEK